jgi:hypothetical protein
MTIISDDGRQAKRNGPEAYGPALAFAVSVLVTFAALIPASIILSKDFALAAVGSLFFAFAAVVAMVAWRFGQPDTKALSYWDVAGALMLFGICAATLMDSDQLVRFLESQRATD